MVLLQPAREFWLPKAGNRSDEYEDAYSVLYPESLGASPDEMVQSAVADGASESAFAREWANVLTSAFVNRPLDLASVDEASLIEWLELAQDEWHECVPWDRIPWHGEAKARAGAHATLMGLSIRTDSDNDDQLIWHAMAVGDSCLFVIREGRLQESFPLETADQFDNYPSLLSSNRSASDGLWENARVTSGECDSGDVFILASDAIACWILGQLEAGDEPFEVVMGMDDADWSEWVDEQRNAGTMRNDDTTLVIIEIG